MGPNELEKALNASRCFAGKKLLPEFLNSLQILSSSIRASRALKGRELIELLICAITGESKIRLIEPNQIGTGHQAENSVGGSFFH